MSRPPTELAARLLRAKAGEMEEALLRVEPGGWSELDWLRADVALLAGLLADHLEREVEQ